MKKIKLADAWIHLLLIISLLITTIAKPLFETVTIAYYIIGGWEVCSMVIHEWNGWFIAAAGIRRIYHWVVFLSIITIPIGSFKILLFTAPLMFGLYGYICFHEVFIKLRRPLALLK